MQSKAEKKRGCPEGPPPDAVHMSSKLTYVILLPFLFHPTHQQSRLLVVATGGGEKGRMTCCLTSSFSGQKLMLALLTTANCECALETCCLTSCEAFGASVM